MVGVVLQNLIQGDSEVYGVDKSRKMGRLNENGGFKGWGNSLTQKKGREKMLSRRKRQRGGFSGKGEKLAKVKKRVKSKS